ncbi:MAG: adenine-specific DNA-methyltransferase [Chloroflexota bacterium]|nr:adenine-specific DNA-methyltransferase [Chloroflexota bacterium]
MAKRDYSDWNKEDLIRRIESLEKRKKYGLVWDEESTIEEFEKLSRGKLPVLKEDKGREIELDDNQPTHILIEGDNYHALSVLNYTHEKKIDVIYIDPPYNTGAKDWKYNNNYIDINDPYRHSKWLSMMNNRLIIAKHLLKDDGVLVCAIDENELARLILLLEDIFRDYEIHCITIVHNPRGIQGSNFSYTHEYALFLFKKGMKVIGKRKIPKINIDWRNLRDNGGESLRVDARNCFYPIIVNDEKIIGFGEVLPEDQHPKKQTEKIGEKYFVYPIDRNGIERKWRYARQSVEEIESLLRIKKRKNGYEIELGKDFGTVRTVWQDSKYDANEYGSKLVNKLVEKSSFNYPKSVFTTYDCIAPILYERKEATVLDFFAGSGTTGHAVMILNKEDGGKRKFILCTNNENKISEEICYPRIKKVIKGHPDYPDITEIDNNLKYFKTDFVPGESTDNNRVIITERSVEMLCLRENTFLEVELGENWKIFCNGKKHTGILFNPEVIIDFRKRIEQIEGKISVYVFSLSNYTYGEAFEGLEEKVTLCAVPESILKVYRRILQ